MALLAQLVYSYVSGSPKPACGAVCLLSQLLILAIFGILPKNLLQFMFSSVLLMRGDYKGVSNENVSKM